MENRRQIQGTVVSTKSSKTIIVQVESYRKHPKYNKRVQFRSKYAAHDEQELANVGDVVTIQECRPISATKRFKLVSIDNSYVFIVFSVNSFTNTIYSIINTIFRCVVFIFHC